MENTTIIEYNGELYENWGSLFYELGKMGKTPKEIDEASDFPLEKYIIQEIMKLDIKERPVR